MEIFYLSPASGTQCRVCQCIGYPYILINYMTKNSTSYAKRARKFAKILLIDSGGFPSSFIYNGYNKSDREYLFFVKSVKADYFVLRDYPCESQILKKYNVTVRDQIHRTLEHHLKLLELYENTDISAEPISVIQGWEIQDYLYCIDIFREHGLILDYTAIGSTCRRHRIKQTQKVILAVKDSLPRKVKLHAFGVKLSVLNDKAVWEALYSADSSAWDFYARWKLWRDKGESAFDASLKTLISYLSKIDGLKHAFSSQKDLGVVVDERGIRS